MSNGFSVPRAEGLKRDKDALCRVIMQEVEDAFGHRVLTSRDCILLSDEVYSKTAVKINPNTLRRFFGLVKAQYPPSFSTLTILANYCGYQSLDELSAFAPKFVAQQAHTEKDILQYLIRLFSVITVRDSIDETSYTFIKYTTQFLDHSPELAFKFQKGIAKTRQGQVCFFEQFINVDRLQSFYGKGLRYYLREKRSIEGQVFGYAQLCLRDWLTLDNESLEKNFSPIRNISITALADPYVNGHYIAAQLLYAYAFQLDARCIVEDAYKMHLVLKRASHPTYLFKSFEYILATVLVLVGLYADALYYIKEVTLLYPKANNPMDQKAQARLRLFRGLAYAQSGIKDEAAAVFKQIHPSQFSFLSKDTDTILYLTLATYLKKGDERLEKQLMELIEKTGFLRLRNVLNSVSQNVEVAPICEQK